MKRNSDLPGGTLSSVPWSLRILLCLGLLSAAPAAAQQDASDLKQEEVSPDPTEKQEMPGGSEMAYWKVCSPSCCLRWKRATASDEFLSQVPVEIRLASESLVSWSVCLTRGNDSLHRALR